MYIVVDAKSHGKKGGPLDFMLSCKNYNYITVTAQYDNSIGARVNILSNPITMTMSSSPDQGTFLLSNPADTDSNGVAYFGFTAPKVNAEETLTITASGHDKAGNFQDATGSQGVTIKPNKLVLSPDLTYNLYVYSKATHQNKVKSCEAITFSACVTDSDSPPDLVTSDVTVTFKINAPTPTTATCTIKAGTQCCTVDGKAPAVTSAEATYTVDVTAKAATCYTDAAEPPNVVLTVEPVKLVITSLTATPASVKVGGTVTVTAVVKDDGTPASPVQGATVVFTLGTATGTKVTDASGTAQTSLVAAKPAGNQTLIATATYAPCYVASADASDTYTPKPVKVDVENPGCDELCNNNFLCVPSSQGCAAGQVAMATGDDWCTEKHSQPLCCCKS